MSNWTGVERRSTRAASPLEKAAPVLRAVQELALARTMERVQEIVRVAARELTGADGATFVLRDGDRCHYADENAIGPLWKGRRFPMSGCISGWVMLNREPAVIEDVEADPRIPIEAYRPTFVRSLAMVPIRAEDPIGAIGTYWTARHRASAEQLALLGALAESTSIAVDNVRVYAELEEQVRRRTAECGRAREELRKTQTGKQQLTDMMVHDLQNPLAGLSSVLQVLRADAVQTDILDEGLERCEELSQMILNVLHISRAESGKLELDLSDVDPGVLASEVVQSFRRTARLAGRSLELDVAPAPRARSDEHLVRRILQNLVRNALRHTPAGSAVRVAAGSDGAGRAALSVIDDGPGIAPEIQERIFEPFGAAALRGKGLRVDSGLGLPTCRALSAALGASLTLESDGKHGTRFTLTLP